MRTHFSNLRETYNALPILERANALVREQGLVEQMIEHVGPVFLNYGMQEHWGIYIIHHHWDLALGEVPGEDHLPEVSGESYVMRPIRGEHALGYAPITFGFIDDEFQALEFSSAKSAIHAYAKLVENPTFVEKLQSVLIEHDLVPHFGLGSIKPLGPSMEWVEMTGNDRRSITTAMQVGAPQQGELIQTAWHFSYGPRRTCTWKCGTNCISDEGAHAGANSLS